VRAASALSTHPIVASALGECVGQVLDALDGARPELVLVAVTPPHLGTLEDVGGALGGLLEPDVVVGAVASAVVGAGRLVRDEPALVLFALHGVAASPLLLVPDGAGGLLRHGDDHQATAAVVLADPYSCTGPALAGAFEGVAACGGLSAVARGPGGSRLLLDGAVRTSGAVGALLGPPARAVASPGGRRGPLEVEADLAATLAPSGFRLIAGLIFPGEDRDGDAHLASELVGVPVAGVGVRRPLAPRAGRTSLHGADATGLALFP